MYLRVSVNVRLSGATNAIASGGRCQSRAAIAEVANSNEDREGAGDGAAASGAAAPGSAVERARAAGCAEMNCCPAGMAIVMMRLEAAPLPRSETVTSLRDLVSDPDGFVRAVHGDDEMDVGGRRCRGDRERVGSRGAGEAILVGADGQGVVAGGRGR